MRNLTLLFILLFWMQSQADMIRIEAGGGIFNAQGSGSIGYDDTPVLDLDTLGHGSNNNLYLWAMLKHPIPILPNARLEYTEIYSDGTAPLDGSGTEVLSSLDLKQYDLTLYYNLLDNTFWMTLDLGLDLKYIESSYQINGLKGHSDNSDSTWVLLYLRSQIEIPTTGLAFEGDIKGFSYDDETLYDARLKMVYTFESVPVVQPGIELGYRMQKLDLELGPLKTDVTFKGFFAGVVARF